jgi:hypothetical protein
MSKSAIIALLLVFSFCTAKAYDPIKGKSHPVSIQITNPLSAASKIGGVFEIRYLNSSFNVGFTTYNSAYKGKQFKFEYEKYIRTWRRNEYFWYIKALGGDATYESDKLNFLGDKSGVTFGPAKYYGGGAGMGRRFNFNHFCVIVNAGVKYVALPEDLTGDQRTYFRVFYATGPGSVFDLNFRLGYQF